MRSTTQSKDADKADEELRVEFEDFSDLQTRLVLLPRVEEEGTGAIVASYFPEDDNVGPNSIDVSGYILMGLVPKSSDRDTPDSINKVDDDDNDWSELEFSSILSKIRQAPSPIILSFQRTLQVKELQQSLPQQSLDEKESKSTNNQRISQKSQQQCHDDYNGSEEKKIESEDRSDSRHCNSQQQTTQDTADNNGESSSSLQITDGLNKQTTMGVLVGSTATASAAAAASFWTKRFIGEATNLARAANERAAKLATAAASNTTSTSAATSTRSASQSANYLSYAIYKQCGQTGEFRRLHQQRITHETVSDSHQQQQRNTQTESLSMDDDVITNTSLLAVRASGTVSCPAAPGQSFQWYRSCNESTIDTLEHTSGCIEDSYYWQILPGAEHPVFQPTATEVGYRLKCVIRITTEISGHEDDCRSSNDSDESSVSSNESMDLNETTRHNNMRRKKMNSVPHRTTRTHTLNCETQTVVYADTALFNGARQALIRGAQFSGLNGLGNAEGRTFALRVRLARRKHQPKSPTSATKPIVCAVTIYQVSGGTAEPIHHEDSPMICVSAISDASNAKQFELILAAQSNRSDAEMISALSIPFEDENDYDSLDAGSSDKGVSRGSINNTNNNDGLLMRFQLQAPNRSARESLLLAIGVANFSGKASDLSESVALYDNDKIPAIPTSWSLASSKSHLSLSMLSSSDGGDGDSRMSTLGDDEFEDNRSLDSTHSPVKSCAHSVSSVKSPEPLETTSPPLRLNSATNPPGQDLASADVQSNEQIQHLEKENQLLRDKLARKNKIIAELQRSIVHADESTREAERKLSVSAEESRKHNGDLQVAQNSLRTAESKIINQEKAMEQIQQSSRQRESEQQKIIQEQCARILELEKANRTLNNEKAILSAAVDARESKLAQMAELKASLATVSAKLSQQETIQQELVECENRCSQITADLERTLNLESNCRKELDEARAQIENLNLSLKEEVVKTTNRQLELEKEQMKVQKLKAERNSFKQKADSLGKEISRVCRNGRTMRDVEKIISDEFTRKQEVELLRKQKQTALDDAQTYRILMEQAQMTQKLMGKSIVTEYESMSIAKLSHRNIELERLVSELTEYITAKEMQLDTMKQINDALQTEMRSLANASLSKNEV